jgi:hypothetical protein
VYTPKAFANFSPGYTPKAFANFSPGYTPKAFANFSPGLFQPWVTKRKAIQRCKRCQVSVGFANAFQRSPFFIFLFPRVETTLG